MTLIPDRSNDRPDVPHTRHITRLSTPELLRLFRESEARAKVSQKPRYGYKKHIFIILLSILLSVTFVLLVAVLCGIFSSKTGNAVWPDFERAQEERAWTAEAKRAELEEELKIIGNNLLGMNEEKALQKQQAQDLVSRAAQQRMLEAESRVEFAERTIQKLQREVDKLEEALLNEREKYKHISDELDETFIELTAR